MASASGPPIAPDSDENPPDNYEMRRKFQNRKAQRKYRERMRSYRQAASAIGTTATDAQVNDAAMATEGRPNALDSRWVSNAAEGAWPQELLLAPLVRNDLMPTSAYDDLPVDFGRTLTDPIPTHTDAWYGTNRSIPMPMMQQLNRHHSTPTALVERPSQAEQTIPSPASMAYSPDVTHTYSKSPARRIPALSQSAFSSLSRPGIDQRSMSYPSEPARMSNTGHNRLASSHIRPSIDLSDAARPPSVNIGSVSGSGSKQNAIMMQLARAQLGSQACEKLAEVEDLFETGLDLGIFTDSASFASDMRKLQESFLHLLE